MRLILSICVVALTGCAYLRSTTTRSTDKNGVVTEKTSATGYALFDSNNNLMKFRNQSSPSGTNQWAPGTYVSGLNETASTSNVVSILNALGNLTSSAAAAAAK